MTNFVFQSPNHSLAFNFDTYNLKYKFNFKNKINTKIDELYDCYLNNNFQQLNKQLQNLYKNNAIFLTDEDCQNTIKYFNKLLVIRNFIKKRLFCSSQSTNDWKIINYEDLLLTKFTSNDTNLIFVPDYLNKHLYAFRVSELLNLYKYALYNVDNDFPRPLPVKNPYTGSSFTLTQHTYIYRHLLKYYCKKNKILPEHFILFKNSYFDPQLFYNKYHIILHYNAINDYTNSLSLDSWLFNMMDFVCDKKYFCPTCFKKCKHVRHLFNNTLQLFLLNDNGIYIYGSGIDQFKDISKKNNLYFPKNHKIRHRPVRRIIRNGRRYSSSIRINDPTENIVTNYIANIDTNSQAESAANIDTNSQAESATNMDIDSQVESIANIDSNSQVASATNMDIHTSQLESSANVNENSNLHYPIQDIVRHTLYDIIDHINGQGIINSSEFVN